MIKIPLAAARVAKGWTQAELAEKMGVSRQSIVDWESGKRKIRTPYFLLFCQLTGFNTSDILLPPMSTKS